MPHARVRSLWPDGSCQVRWRSRLRCGSEVGASWLAIAPSGRSKSGVEIFVSICLFGFTWPSPKSKNVCQPTNRRGARRPPRRSAGSARALLRRIEDEGEERLPAVAGEVGAVRGSHHAVPEPVRAGLELDRNERLARCRLGRSVVRAASTSSTIACPTICGRNSCRPATGSATSSAGAPLRRHSPAPRAAPCRARSRRRGCGRAGTRSAGRR